MHRSRKQLWFAISITALVCSVLVFGMWYADRSANKAAVQEATNEQSAAADVPVLAPEHAKKNEVSIATTTTPTSTRKLTSKGFNIPIQFISQAPRKIWDAKHEDYCEEASLLMLRTFIDKKRLTIGEQEAQLAAIYNWEMKTFGYFESTTVSEVVRIAKELLNFKHVRVVDNPTYEQIRAEAAIGHPIIVPTDGKALHNPFFKNGGPPYHMLVIRGFTAAGDFIVNDPGTQHGENYVYKKAILMNAIHDWNHGPTDKIEASGTPRMIVIE